MANDRVDSEFDMDPEYRDGEPPSPSLSQSRDLSETPATAPPDDAISSVLQGLVRRMDDMGRRMDQQIQQIWRTFQMPESRARTGRDSAREPEAIYPREPEAYRRRGQVYRGEPDEYRERSPVNQREPEEYDDRGSRERSPVYSRTQKEYRGRESINHRKPLVRPTAFDGKMPWEDYRVQFELVSDLNGWDDHTKVAQATSVTSGEEQGGLHELLKEIVAGQHSLFKQLADKNDGGKRTSKPQANSSMPSAGRTCWTCNKRGHFRRDCPVERERNVDRRTDMFHDTASRNGETRNRQGNGEPQNRQGNGETRNRQGNGEPQNWQGNGERPSSGVETRSEYQQQITSEVKIGAVNTEGQSVMFVAGNIEGTSVRFLLDTGANVTIINLTVYYEIPESCRPSLEEVKTRMVLADGSSVPFLGRSIFKLTIDGRLLEQEIWVASIDLEGILGMDFLRRHGCGIVPRDGQLELIFPVRKEKEVIEAHSDEVVPPRCCKVAQMAHGTNETPSCMERWVQQWSTEELHRAQADDPMIAPILKWLQEGNGRPAWAEIAPLSPSIKAYWAQWENLCLRDGVVYRRWESEDGDRVTFKLVLPGNMRREVMVHLHDSQTAGHLGVKKTIARVKERFYWCGSSRDLREWCQKCDLCASRRGPRRTPRAPMQSYSVGAPFERAREHLRLETQRHKRLYDHKLNVSKFKQGDPVWFFNPRRRKGYSPKLQRPWEGPYTIVKKINDVVYRIRRSPSSKCNVVHHDKLQPYKGRSHDDDDDESWRSQQGHDDDGNRRNRRGRDCDESRCLGEGPRRSTRGRRQPVHFAQFC